MSTNKLPNTRSLMNIHHGNQVSQCNVGRSIGACRTYHFFHSLLKSTFLKYFHYCYYYHHIFSSYLFPCVLVEGRIRPLHSSLPRARPTASRPPRLLLPPRACSLQRLSLDTSQILCCVSGCLPPRLITFTQFSL